ncbi:DUF4158 domain-containing protein [Nocardia sp. NPDC058519]|uniref:DUF4158 domain-containing protein n=1 Tax=Nocardia sp. NPDC058519 TaxID=3346535 RepID=UPI00365C99C3
MISFRGDDEGGYGRFGALSRIELERFFHLDDEDRRLVAGRRRDYNRLGFALQVVTVRQLGRFLADPLEVPPDRICRYCRRWWCCGRERECSYGGGARGRVVERGGSPSQ